jgi:hypothetical protein
MDANTLNRREKRHYRKVVDGEIVYTTSPVDEISDNNSSYKPEKIKVEKIVPTNISLDKKELMNKVLDNMSEVINPDMDSIADTIYEQLKENNIDVEKKTIKNAVTKHYRASTGTSSSTEESDEGFDSSIDRDKLKLVVDDLYVQIENENKTEELNKAKEKVVLENIKKEKDKEQSTKPKETPKKTKEQEKPTKKNDISKLLQEDDLDLSDDEDSDDDLGLKF